MKITNMITVVTALLLMAAASAKEDTAGQEGSYAHNFYYANGAEVRFLQLEKNIERNILQGEYIIDKILEQDPGADVAELENMLEELKTLNQKLTLINYTQNASQLAKEFILIKTNATKLTGNFRNVSNNILDVSVQDEVKQQVKSKFQERFKGLDDQITKTKNMYNGIRVEEFLSQAGTSDQEMVRKVKNGTLSLNQIRTQLMQKYNNLEDGLKEQLKVQLQEQNMKQEVFGQSVVEMAGNMIRQNYQNRGENAQNRSDAQDKNSNGDDSPGNMQDNQGSHGSNGNSGGSDVQAGGDGSGDGPSDSEGAGNTDTGSGTNSDNAGSSDNSGGSGSDGSGSTGNGSGAGTGGNGGGNGGGSR